MNRNRGQVSWVSLMILISLLLFKGVAVAAMLCCGPDHSEHTSSHSQLAANEHSHMAVHGHHTAEMNAKTTMMTDNSNHQMTAEHASSCPGCAVSCATAALMINPSDFISDLSKTERIISFTPFVIPLTSSGLERPPRLHS